MGRPDPSGASSRYWQNEWRFPTRKAMLSLPKGRAPWSIGTGSITHSNSDIICRSSFQAMGRQEKFIQRDRKIVHTSPGRVINRVSNCCRDSGYTDFAGPTSSDWIENRVRLTDKMDIDVRHVGVSSYQVVSKIGVRIASSRFLQV